MNEYDSCGLNGSFKAEDTKQRICYIHEGCVVMGYHEIDADEDTGEILTDIYLDALGEVLPEKPELVECPELAAFVGCGGGAGGGGGDTLTEDEIIELIEKMDKYCPECFTKDDITSLIKNFFIDNGCECITKEDVADLIKQYFIDNGCECMTAEQIIKIMNQEIKDNAYGTIDNIINSLVNSPITIDIEDAFGTHQFTALP